MIKKENNMNELNCKKCDTPTTCDEEAVAITCSKCSMLDVIGLIEGIGSLSDEEIEALANEKIGVA